MDAPAIPPYHNSDIGRIGRTLLDRMIAHYNTTASDRSHIYMCILFGEKHDCVALHDVILHVIIILYVVVVAYLLALPWSAQ